MDNRFGYDGNEGLIFDRTKPCKDCDSDEDCGMFEEVTTDELIEHANSTESKLGERDQEIARLTEIVDDATIRLDDRQKRLDEQEARLEELQKAWREDIAAREDGRRIAVEERQGVINEYARRLEDAESRLNGIKALRVEMVDLIGADLDATLQGLLWPKDAETLNPPKLFPEVTAAVEKAERNGSYTATIKIGAVERHAPEKVKCNRCGKDWSSLELHDCEAR